MKSITTTGYRTICRHFLAASFAVFAAVTAEAGAIGSVRSTGTQYVKTGFTPDGTTEIAVRYKLTAMPTASNKGYVFGEWGSNLGRLQFSHHPSSDGTSYVGFFGFGKTYSNLMPFTADTQWHTIEYRTGMGFYHDGSLVTIPDEYIPSASDEKDFTKWGGTPAELYLYACDGNGKPQDETLSKTDIASCRITKGGTVVRDLVAWKKDDGTVCFKNLAYDGTSANGAEYYASAVSDAFVAGDGVPDALSVAASPVGYGAPEPVTTNGLSAGASFTCSYPDYVSADGMTKAVATGWTLTDASGVQVDSGSGNSFTYTHPTPAANRILTWTLAVSNKVVGVESSCLTYDPAEQWVALGGSATVTAVPKAGCTFVDWVSLPEGATKSGATASFGNVTAPVTVSAACDFTATSIALAKPAGWTGKAVIPQLTVTCGDNALVQGVDYTVSCTDTKIGPATATVTGIGTWTGVKTFDFNIVQNPDGFKVTLDRVAQRYPWNGLVDIDYTVSGFAESGINPLDVEISFAFSSVSAGKNLVCPTAGTVADGTYRLTWDLGEVAALASDAKLTAKIDILGMPTASDAEFMVVDLSNGYDQKHAITYVRGTSAGSESEKFNTDEYKTSKIVLRKVHAAGKTFRMGVGTGSGGKLGNVTNDDPTEGNWHEVGFTKDYFLGIFEFTYGQFKTIMGGDKNGENQMTYPSNMAAADPVDICGAYRISYNELNSSISIKRNGTATTVTGGVIGWLNSHLDTESSSLFALPTEAQWEYAARNGTRTTHSWGNYYDGDWVGFPKPYVWWSYTSSAARWGGGSGYCGHGVGRKSRDSWGFYDLIGNWAEVVNDWYDSNGYESGAGYVAGGVTMDPTGPADDAGFTSKVARGGCFQYGTLYSSGDRSMSIGVSGLNNLYGSRLKANVESGGTTGPSETIWTTSVDFSLDESFSAYGVLSPAAVADILPIAWNSDTNWPAGGDAEATATLTLSAMSGDRAADPAEWTSGTTSTLLTQSGEGTFVWTPTESRLYRLQLTVGESVLSAYFDLTDTTGIEALNATVESPAGAVVAAVEQSGATILPQSDGTYRVAASKPLTITYRTTGDRLFSDGSTERVVSNVTPAATIPASTCDLAVVPAVARVGETKYVSVQAAFDVGGEVVLMADNALAASVTLGAGDEVRFDLGGRVLTADGITAFVNVGTLEVRNGTVMAGTLVENTGAFTVKEGTYSEDVSAWCAPGFHVVEQATEPPTWNVVVNESRSLSLALADLAEKHIASVALACDGDFTCATNDDVIAWSLPGMLPYTLTYTAANGYIFGSTNTVSVHNATGLSEDHAIDRSELPTPEEHIVWVWDEKAKTLTDGNWTFHEVTKGGSGLTIASTTYEHKYTAVSNVDFTTCAETAGAPLVSVTASLSSLPVRKFIAPDLVWLSTFGESKTIEEVVVSPNLNHVGEACFYNCHNLRKLTPTALPKLAFAKKIFGNCYKLEGDFELDAWQVVTEDEPFSHCEKVTSLKLPNLTRCNKNIEFGYMYALTNFYAPNLVYMNSATLAYCSKLKTVVISDAIGYMGYGIFDHCTSLDSLSPTTFTNLTWVGQKAFSSCKSLRIGFSAPVLGSLEQSAFADCSLLESVYAPNAGFGSNAKYAFNNCTNLTSVTIKGSADLGEQCTFQNLNPKAKIDWLGTDVPTRLGSYGVCGVGATRINVCVKDDATRNAWISALATRVKDTTKYPEKAGFTAEDRANPTYPGPGTVAVALPGGGCYFWISRPPLPLTVIIR